MQPDSELNKRPRKRQGTPTNVKDQENVNSQRLLAGQLSTPTVSHNLMQKQMCIYSINLLFFRM